MAIYFSGSLLAPTYIVWHGKPDRGSRGINTIRNLEKHKGPHPNGMKGSEGSHQIPAWNRASQTFRSLHRWYQGWVLSWTCHNSFGGGGVPRTQEELLTLDKLSASPERRHVVEMNSIRCRRISNVAISSETKPTLLNTSMHQRCMSQKKWWCNLPVFRRRRQISATWEHQRYVHEVILEGGMIPYAGHMPASRQKWLGPLKLLVVS